MSPHSHYRYTLDTELLTDDQRAFYEENGYIVVPRLVSQEHLDTYRERFRQICQREVKVRGVVSRLQLADCSVLPAVPRFDSDERCGHCQI